MKLAAALALAAIAPAAFAQAGTACPPAGEPGPRVRELQAVIGAKSSTREQREAARLELGCLLLSPAGRERGLPLVPARAAVQPAPASVVPAYVPKPAPPASEVARVEVLEPPRLVVNPRTGAVVVPAVPAAPAAAPAFGIDARTGAVVHPAGNGYVDPRTGQLTPR